MVVYVELVFTVAETGVPSTETVHELPEMTDCGISIVKEPVVPSGPETYAATVLPSTANPARPSTLNSESVLVTMTAWSDAVHFCTLVGWMSEEIIWPCTVPEMTPGTMAVRVSVPALTVLPGETALSSVEASVKPE
jgi:hypothetical protein